MDSSNDISEIPWDPYSEQPYPIRHRRGLLARLRYAWPDYLKTGALALAMAPFVVGAQIAFSLGYRPARWQRPPRDSRDFVGLAVALHSCDGPRQAREINELGVRKLLLRIPVWELDQLHRYAAFIDSLPSCEIAVCIMQTRAEVVDLQRWRTALRAIVENCWARRVREFQIGQGSNRSKWGFFSTQEFLAFASVAEELRPEFPGIRFIGPGILDFETMPLLRSLAHGYPIRWDVVGCALYVDRRGSPHNRQMLFFNTRQKIMRFAACISLATKAQPRFWITEVNWPLTGQGAYAPTSENDCVPEEDAARYLAEYYQIAWQSGVVERVYWWQLVAKGYGLIDVDSQGQLRRRPAYHAFKKLVEQGVPPTPN